MSVSRVAHDVDVFETGATIQPDVAQILPEKPETFAEKKDGDEPENDNGNEGVAPEKRLDEVVGAPAANGQRSDYRRRGDNFSHPPIMAPWRRWRQMPKCYDCVTILRKEKASVSIASSDNVQLNMLLDIVLRHNLNDLRYSQVFHIY